MNNPKSYASLVADLSATLVIAAVVLVACEPSGPEPPGEQFPPDPDLPPAVVDLPNPPPESAFEIDTHNEDGSLRVEGIISHREQYMDDDVDVRGTVSEIIGADCDPSVERCYRLHLFIRDHLDDDLDLMVVGFDDDFLETADIREGEEYLFEGTYTESAHDFETAEGGLIDLESVDDHEVPDLEN